MHVRIDYQEHRLANGLRVLVHEDHRLPLASVNLWYRVGSKDERPGRTGFAHLFEHLMFEGSENVPPGAFDKLLEEVGGINNGSTSPDRTNYWITVPSTALELALFLEADRMGGLEAVMTQQKLDAQRDVVMNERRQSYENRPYGLAYETMLRALYPPEHSYRWPVIGSMDDLRAASLPDVLHFFETYYAPSNALLAVGGAVRTDDVMRLVESHFGAIPGRAEPARAAPPPVVLERSRRLMMEDVVRLPRLYLTWHSPPRFAEHDAALELLSAVIAQGRASRLYRSLVHDRQVAQDVSAYQNGGSLAGAFTIVLTARPEVPLDVLEEAVRAELLRLVADGPAQVELERARSRVVTSFVDALETVGGFGGKVDQLNYYACFADDAAFIEQDLARYERATATDLRDATARWLSGPDVALSVVPTERPELALSGSTRIEEGE
jgi:zinc protease